MMKQCGRIVIRRDAPIALWMALNLVTLLVRVIVLDREEFSTQVQGTEFQGDARIHGY